MRVVRLHRARCADFDVGRFLFQRERRIRLTQAGSVNTQDFPGRSTPGSPRNYVCYHGGAAGRQWRWLRGGGHAGYNKQFGSFVVGVRSTSALYPVAGRRAPSAARPSERRVMLRSVTGVSRQIDWLATSRVRLGFSRDAEPAALRDRR